MKRRLSVLAVAAVTVVSVSGATHATPTPAPTPTATPTPPRSDGTLTILTYRGYAEYGGINRKVNWTGSFEKQTGCRIARLDQVQTADEMRARLTERAYDLVSAGPGLAGELIAAEKVQPLVLDKVEGYDKLGKRLRELTTQDGKAYGVPYLWGSHEFVYDGSKVGSPSVKDVFASARASLKDDPLTIADAALATGAKGDPYTLGEAQLDSALDLLKEQTARSYWKAPLDLLKGFATGSYDYAQVTPYLRRQLQAAGQPVEAIETSRTTGWADSWMLGAGVANSECAYRWLSWTADPEVQRDAAAWVGLAPAHPQACKGAARRVCDAYGATDTKALDRIEYAVRSPSDYRIWADKWRSIVG
ncbi:extracellular solute-binding protein [Nonomuraea longicatena]|uniref:extracellular solute-binding protein n=1 Tax=Nonomuraea longicatena TaxID=83682 RepID=UPI0031E2931B